MLRFNAVVNSLTEKKSMVYQFRRPSSYIITSAKAVAAKFVESYPESVTSTIHIYPADFYPTKPSGNNTIGVKSPTIVNSICHKINTNILLQCLPKKKKKNSQ